MAKMTQSGRATGARLLAVWLGLNALLVPLVLPLLLHPTQLFAGPSEIAAAMVAMGAGEDPFAHHAPGHAHHAHDSDCALCVAAHGSHGATPLRLTVVPAPRVEPVVLVLGKPVEPGPHRAATLRPSPRAPPYSA